MKDYFLKQSFKILNIIWRYFYLDHDYDNQFVNYGRWFYFGFWVLNLIGVLIVFIGEVSLVSLIGGVVWLCIITWVLNKSILLSISWNKAKRIYGTEWKFGKKS